MVDSKLVKKIKNWLFKPTKKPPVVAVAKAWSLAVKGELVKKERLNIDKSGKKPRYLLYGTIRVESYELEGADFEVPKLLNFKGKETDLKKQAEQSFTVGEKVCLKFADTGLPTERFVYK